MPGDKSMLRVVHESGKCGVPKRDTCHFTISSTRLEGLCAPGSSALALSRSLWLDQCFFFGRGGGEGVLWLWKFENEYQISWRNEKTIALHVPALGGFLTDTCLQVTIVTASRGWKRK